MHAGGREGWSSGRGLVSVLASLFLPYPERSDVKSYLGYFAPSNRGARRFRDGIWVMNTERRSIVPPSSVRGSCQRVSPGGTGTIPARQMPSGTGPGFQLQTLLPCQCLQPLPHISFMFNGLIAPVISLKLT